MDTKSPGVSLSVAPVPEFRASVYKSSHWDINVSRVGPECPHSVSIPVTGVSMSVAPLTEFRASVESPDEARFADRLYLPLVLGLNNAYAYASLMESDMRQVLSGQAKRPRSRKRKRKRKDKPVDVEWNGSRCPDTIDRILKKLKKK